MLDLPLGDRGLKLMPLVALLFEEEAMDMLAEGILHKLRVLKHVECLFERARQRRVAGLNHLTVGELERLGRGLGRELQLALDAVQTSRQRDGVDQVRIGHGVGAAQLDARGQLLAGLVDRDADHARAVAQAPRGVLRHRVAARGDTLVRVDRGVGDGADLARVRQDAGHVVLGDIGEMVLLVVLAPKTLLPSWSNSD